MSDSQSEPDAEPMPPELRAMLQGILEQFEVMKTRVVELEAENAELRAILRAGQVLEGDTDD